MVSGQWSVVSVGGPEIAHNARTNVVFYCLIACREVELRTV